MRTALIYLAFGILWILSSDAIVLRLVSEPQLLTHFQNFKGILFVVLSAAIILLLNKSDERRREKAEGILRESEERFRATFEQSALGLAHVGVDTRLLRVNNKLCEITGRTREELLQLTISDITHPDDKERDRINVLRLFRREIPLYQTEKRYLRPDGSAIWVHVTVSTVRDAHGVPQYNVAAIKDITERKQVEQELRDSEERFRATFEQAAIGMAHVAPDGRWLRVNKKLCEITGYSAEELLGGMTYQQITHADDVGSDTAQAHKLLAGKIATYHMEKRYWRKDQSLAWVQITVSIARDTGAPPYFIAAIEDISERKEVEAKIASLTTTLDRRVRERTAQLAEANRDLESFSYSVSHDLRAPLRAISGFAQIIARRHRDSLNDEARHYLNNILHAAERMNLLLDDLLRYSRLGRQALQLQAVPLPLIFEQIKSDLSDKIASTKAQIEIASPLPTVQGDPTLLRQIFSNLLDNALKYHHETPHIIVSSEEKDDCYIVRVSDNGIGIPAEYHEKIFNVFQRLHGEETYPGTGIGLALVAKAATLMDGKVILESSYTSGQNTSHGSVFAVILHKADSKEASKKDIQTWHTSNGSHTD